MPLSDIEDLSEPGPKLPVLLGFDERFLEQPCNMYVNIYR